MTDSFLFIVSPYLTAAAVSGCIARYAFTTRRDGDDAAAARGADAMSRPVRAAWRWAIGFVAAGHLLALGFPESVLRWNQQPLRLLALEKRSSSRPKKQRKRSIRENRGPSGS